MLEAREVPIHGDQRTDYIAALVAMRDGGVDFLVGGGFALHVYLRRWRSTKDLDVFVRPEHARAALDALAAAGFATELTDPSWIVKAKRGTAFIDVIFCSYNGLFRVDDGWFENARESEVLGVPVKM